MIPLQHLHVICDSPRQQHACLIIATACKLAAKQMGNKQQCWQPDCTSHLSGLCFFLARFTLRKKLYGAKLNRNWWPINITGLCILQVIETGLGNQLKPKLRCDAWVFYKLTSQHLRGTAVVCIVGSSKHVGSLHVSVNTDLEDSCTGRLDSEGSKLQVLMNNSAQCKTERNGHVNVLYCCVSNSRWNVLC